MDNSGMNMGIKPSIPMAIAIMNIMALKMPMFIRSLPLSFFSVFILDYLSSHHFYAMTQL